MHIPPTAFLTVQQTVLPDEGKEDARFPGLNDDVPLAAEGDGTEDVTFMQALVDTKGLHSVYSGHDHGDAWCGLWPNVTGVTVGEESGVDGKGPFVCFCKHSGYGGYGNVLLPKSLISKTTNSLSLVESRSEKFETQVWLSG